MMFKNSTAVTLTALSLLLAGCGGSDSDPDSNNDPDPASLSVKNANLANVDIQGAYSTGCYGASVDGVEESIDITADSWTYTVHTYAGDTTCTAGGPAQEQVVATLTVGSDLAVTGWVNGNGDTVNAPELADGSVTLLPSNSAYTLLNLEVTSSSMTGIAAGDSVPAGYVVDNSSTDGLVLYRLRNEGTLTATATIADPFTNIPGSGGGGGGGTTGGPNIVVIIDSVSNTGYSDTEISYTLWNFGDTTSEAFQVMGWLDRASAPDYNSAQSGKFELHGAMAPSDSVAGVITVDATTVTPGTALNAYVIADYAQEVTESDEGVTTDSLDNLAHKAWTVSDIFVDNVYGTFVEKFGSAITATYEFSAATRIIMGGSSGGTSVAVSLVLIGEVAAGTYTYAAAEMAVTTFVRVSGTAYGIPVFGAAPAVSVTIDQAGAVGELVTGSYSMDLCPGPQMGASGCNVAPTNFSGSFTMVRDPDIG